MRVPFKTSADIIGHVTDIDGDVYWCSKATPTDFGFYIWFGRREHSGRTAPQAVLTQEVYDHMKAHDFSPKRCRLPLSEGVMRKFRQRAGIIAPHSKAYREWKARITPPPKTLKDIDGTEFRVVSENRTELGVTLYQGTPLDRLGNGRAIILTPALTAVIREWKFRPNTAARLLGITPNPMRLLRNRLGMNYHSEINLWWGSRLDDLLTLSPAEFATKHGRSLFTVRREKGVLRRVIRMLQEPEGNEDTIALLKADFGRGEKGMINQIGAKAYEKLAPYRRAYLTLGAAGALDDIHSLDARKWHVPTADQMAPTGATS